MSDNGLLLLTLVVVVAGVAIRWLAALRNGRRAARHPLEAASTPASWPSVSVIVPAWNEAGTIERCLATLAHVDYPTWELLVVAGGTDETFAAAQAAIGTVPASRVLVIPQAPGGKPAALNAGLELATGDVAVFLDADSLVTPGWLRALVAPLTDATPAASGNPSPTVVTPVTLAEAMERISAYDVHRRFVLQGSGSIAIRRSALDEIGGFPDDAYADDWDLDARLALAGHARAYAVDARLQTERPATLDEFWRNELRWRRAHLASVLQLPGYFLADVPTALRTMYPYVLALLVASVTAAMVVVLGIGSPEARLTALGVWLILLAGVLAERLSLTIEVVACTGDRRWIREAWGPPVLWLVTLAAAFIATLTVRRASLAFKGPRRLATIDPARPGPRAR